MQVRSLLILVSILFAVISPGRGQTSLDSDTVFRAVSRRPVRPDNSARIEALIRQMTVEKKVGQMTQLTIDMVTGGADQSIGIDRAKLEKAVVRYGVGSILNVNNQALTLDRWHQIIGPIQQAAQRTRLKIPVIYGMKNVFAYDRHGRTGEDFEQQECRSS